MMLTFLSGLLNAYLKLDPLSSARLKKMEEKAIFVEINSIGLSFYITFKDEKIVLVDETILPIDAVIRGTPLMLTAAVFSKKNRQKFFSEEIIIEGNAETAQAVIQLFDAIDIDWEELLSRAVGDIPAHHTGRTLRKITRWFKRAKETCSENISDYIIEEKRLSPSSMELSDFYHDVDELRMAVDRIEARFSYLTKNYSEGRESS